jgi:hypothetical protein
MNFFSYFIPF